MKRTITRYNPHSVQVSSDELKKMARRAGVNVLRAAKGANWLTLQALKGATAASAYFDQVYSAGIGDEDVTPETTAPQTIAAEPVVKKETESVDMEDEEESGSEKEDEEWEEEGEGAKLKSGGLTSAPKEKRRPKVVKIDSDSDGDDSDEDAEPVPKKKPILIKLERKTPRLINKTTVIRDSNDRRNNRLGRETRRVLSGTSKLLANRDTETPKHKVGERIHGNGAENEREIEAYMRSKILAYERNVIDIFNIIRMLDAISELTDTKSLIQMMDKKDAAKTESDYEAQYSNYVKVVKDWEIKYDNAQQEVALYSRATDQFLKRITVIIMLEVQVAVHGVRKAMKTMVDMGVPKDQIGLFQDRFYDKSKDHINSEFISSILDSLCQYRLDMSEPLEYRSYPQIVEKTAEELAGDISDFDERNSEDDDLRPSDATLVKYEAYIRDISRENDVVIPWGEHSDATIRSLALMEKLPKMGNRFLMDIELKKLARQYVNEKIVAERSLGDGIEYNSDNLKEDGSNDISTNNYISYRSKNVYV